MPSAFGHCWRSLHLRVQGEIPAQTELIAHHAFPKGRAASLKRLGPDGSRSVLPPPRTLSALIGVGATELVVMLLGSEDEQTRSTALLADLAG